ncbi:probable membrane-associated kinase regulator 3 [Solanum dulcamara]|uniref:probable membrane-associated kinase regulator 3 n=1 Tax=Solanum dulcamara TaxID=45834 RepID=UPI002484DBA9|nr:probable membrane-associated kinase regulator 3 [Solanum dulcamara]
MAINPLPSSMYHLHDEEYIDIEVSSYYYFSSSTCPNSSSPQNSEFEFQITNYNKESTTFPADELFYRGKLLPLHQKILQTKPFEGLEDSFCINFLITPIVSPTQTCNVSFELNPNNHKISPNKLWSNLIKHSLKIQKFKASKAFLKSLFIKSSCTNINICSSKDMKVSKKKTTNNTSCAINKNEGLSSRWHSSTKCLFSSSTNSSTNGGSFSSSSSNSSFNSNNGFTSEIVEGSIEAAVAHCKKSQEFGWA